MLASSAAQSATLRFKRQTWAVVALLLVAHVIGFAVLTTQVETRYK